MSFFSALRRIFDRLLNDERPSGRRVDRVMAAPVPTAPTAQVIAPDSPVTFDPRLTRARIHRAFAAALPVEDRFGLSGRLTEIDRLVRAVTEERKHAIVFGARGSGKTSLARVFGEMADEAGQVVLYESTSGDMAFDDLFRPFLTALPGADRDGPLVRQIAGIADHRFSARELAAVLTEVRQPCVLVLDEFDRITDPAVKENVATLMKLLSDMHARTTLVIVGIATNVDDLVSGHASLRRHMVAVPVGPIAATDLQALLIDCARKANMTIAEPEAGAMAKAAYGSPYHARLFGLEAALSAHSRGKMTIDADDVHAGFVAALTGWGEVSEDNYALFADVAHDPAATNELIRIARIATQALGTAQPGEPAGDTVGPYVDWIAPALLPSAAGGYVFRDSLAPQFLALMLEQRIRADRFGRRT